mmetsp:Transcript_56312/g.138204  ORF Transcript_56312/g.138204 Transcript_56312/m.138204 type:complete len:388 (-) Transcript_56312:269-1432(-)
MISPPGLRLCELELRRLVVKRHTIDTVIRPLLVVRLGRVHAVVLLFKLVLLHFIGVVCVLIPIDTITPLLIRVMFLLLPKHLLLHSHSSITQRLRYPRLYCRRPPPDIRQQGLDSFRHLPPKLIRIPELKHISLLQNVAQHGRPHCCSDLGGVHPPLRLPPNVENSDVSDLDLEEPLHVRRSQDKRCVRDGYVPHNDPRVLGDVRHRNVALCRRFVRRLFCFHFFPEDLVLVHCDVLVQQLQVALGRAPLDEIRHVGHLKVHIHAVDGHVLDNDNVFVQYFFDAHSRLHVNRFYSHRQLLGVEVVVPGGVEYHQTRHFQTLVAACRQIQPLHPHNRAAGRRPVHLHSLPDHALSTCLGILRTPHVRDQSLQPPQQPPPRGHKLPGNA